MVPNPSTHSFRCCTSSPNEGGCVLEGEDEGDEKGCWVGGVAKASDRSGVNRMRQ